MCGVFETVGNAMYSFLDDEVFETVINATYSVSAVFDPSGTLRGGGGHSTKPSE